MRAIRFGSISDSTSPWLIPAISEVPATSPTGVSVVEIRLL